MGKKVISWGLKILGIALAIGLLVWTVRRTDADPLHEIMQANRPILILALLCVGLTHILAAYRWGALLAVQDIHLSYWTLLKLTWVGTFFSQLIPGAVSGDLLKLAYVAKSEKGRGTEAFLTIIMDRVVGVTGLFLVASLGGLLFMAGHWELATSNRVIGLSLLVVFGGGAASLVGLCVFVYHKMFMNWNWLSRIVTWLGNHLPAAVTGIVKRLCDGADLYKNAKKTLLFAVLISMVIHASLGNGLFCVGRALGERDLSYTAYFLSTQIGNAVTLVPATPGGLGLRDSVSSAFFAALDAAPSEKTGAIPVVNSMLVVFWALVGAVCLGWMNTNSLRKDS
ncbi:MAG: flippase-like domain-containing protein [Victivallales bacterium]|nr:flippase-like domain-containing protein [Victivallales bacterium]